MSITPINSITNTHNKQVNDLTNTQESKTQLVAYYDSVCGTTHPNNEDCVKIAPPFYGIADGVGGGAGGDIASATLLNTCVDSSKEMDIKNLNENIINQILYQADSDIKAAISEIANDRGASTLVAAWLNNQGQGVYTWVGDARIYRIDIIDTGTTVGSMVHLTQLTTDHTYGNVKDHVPEGWKADDPAYMVGVGKRVIGNPECLAIELQAKQGLLLCSDGVHKFMSHNQMCQTLEELINLYGLQEAISKYAAQLINVSVQLGSYDDCSALIVYKTKVKSTLHALENNNTLDINTPINDIITDSVL